MKPVACNMIISVLLVSSCRKPLSSVVIVIIIITQANRVGVGRIFESVCLSVCLSAVQSKANDPKVFKGMTLG